MNAIYYHLYAEFKYPVNQIKSLQSHIYQKLVSALIHTFISHVISFPLSTLNYLFRVNSCKINYIKCDIKAFTELFNRVQLYASQQLFILVV